MEHILWYQDPARYFEEALPLGNGRIGAMVYGNPREETISLNEDTLWSGYPRYHSLPNPYDAYIKARQLTLNGKIPEAEKALEDGFSGNWTQSYMPLGTMHLNVSLPGDVKECVRSLDLSQAVCTTQFVCSGAHHTRKHFVSHHNDAFISCLTCDQPGQISFDLTFSSQLRSETTLRDGNLVLQGICPSNVLPNGHSIPGKDVVYSEIDEEKGICFTVMIKVKTQGGSLEWGKGAIRVSGANSATIYFCVKTSFNGFDKLPFLEGKEHEKSCLSQINAVSEQDFDQLLKEHLKDFQALYGRVSFHLDGPSYEHLPTDQRMLQFQENHEDKGLYELLFHFGRYLIISSSRAGTQATNLQGIWNEQLRPPWSSNYTVNINTEMNYWPVLMCDLAECNQPIVDLVQKIRVTGKKTARDFYHARGFVSHHNIDLWGHSTPVGVGLKGASIYSFWCMSSGWLCRHLFEQYEYTMDEDFLREVCYPTLKEAAQFYLDLIIKDEDGYWILCPSTSPENAFLLNGKPYSVTKTTTMTISILKDLFQNCIKSCEILHTDQEFKQQLEEICKDLLPYRIGSRGQLLEWYEELPEKEPQHRHCSHLYGLHPANLITVDKTPELAEACRVTLKERGDDGTGWSLGWKVNFWARLKDGDHALKLVQRQLKPVGFDTINRDEVYSSGGGTYKNLFDAHPPFQIDGNFGVTSGIGEMLLQSRAGIVELLPALPSNWQKGEVSGLKAKGNIMVSMTWSKGKLENATLVSPIEQTVMVKYQNKKYEVELKRNIPYKIF